MLKKVVQSLLPIFKITYVKLFNPNNKKNVLFHGDDDLFKREVSKVKIYGEYGVGKSTKWVLGNTEAKVIAVDTSKEWIQNVMADCGEYFSQLNITHVDLGNLGKWGRPVSYEYASSFEDYTDTIWSQKDKPKCVLIDGRFRVCCFLTTLKYADSDTKIIFDDYVNRRYYHFVEKYVSRVEECGRQCLFIVPEKNDIDFVELENDINKFRYVFD